MAVPEKWKCVGCILGLKQYEELRKGMGETIRKRSAEGVTGFRVALFSAISGLRDDGCISEETYRRAREIASRIERLAKEGKWDEAYSEYARLPGTLELAEETCSRVCRRR